MGRTLYEVEIIKPKYEKICLVASLLSVVTTDGMDGFYP